MKIKGNNMQKLVNIVKSHLILLFKHLLGVSNLDLESIVDFFNDMEDLKSLMRILKP